MTLSELHTILTSTELPVAYSAFRDDEKIGPPCITYEVAYSQNFGAEDFKHLKWFAKNLAKGEFTGIVLYSGEHTLRFGEGFYAVPLAALGA